MQIMQIEFIGRSFEVMAALRTVLRNASFAVMDCKCESNGKIFTFIVARSSKRQRVHIDVNTNKDYRSYFICISLQTVS